MAREKETGRVEAFSDGVFAIAITLLILEIQVPRLGPGATNRGLLHGLLLLWPSYIAYLGSFAAILIMWVNHHGFFRLLENINAKLLFANGFLLLLITFVPFPTAVLAAYLNHKGAVNTAAAFYCSTYVLISIGYNILWFASAKAPRLFHPAIPEHHLQKIRNAYLGGTPIYVLATVVACWHAYLGLAICLAPWLFWSRLDYQPRDS